MFGLLYPDDHTETRWSPYYAIVYDPTVHNITANTIAHQGIDPFEIEGYVSIR